MRNLVFNELCAAPSRYAYEVSFSAFAEILDAALERSGPWGLQHAWTFDDGYQSDLAAEVWAKALYLRGSAAAATEADGRGLPAVLVGADGSMRVAGGLA